MQHIPHLVDHEGEEGVPDAEARHAVVLRQHRHVVLVDRVERVADGLRGCGRHRVGEHPYVVVRQVFGLRGWEGELDT